MADTIPKHMRAAQYDHRDNKCHINTVPVPTPKPYELLVRTLCSSLCRSDLMNFESDEIGLKPTDPDFPPITMGHEAAGVVVAVGSDCSGFEVGQEVGFLPSTNVCFDCDNCKIHVIWCEAFEGGCKNPGHQTDGFFQEYIAIHHRNAIVLPKELSAVEAAPLFCAGVTSYHGIADLGLGSASTIGIIGCGGLGHLGVQYAKAMGHTVVGLDISDEQLQEARACGADHVFNLKKDPEYVNKVKALTAKGRGLDAVVNYTSSKPSYDAAPKVLKVGGILMVVGHPQQPIAFSSIDIALGRFIIKGASNSTPANLKECIDFSVQHGIKTHTTYYKSLDDVPKMIDVLMNEPVQGRLAVRLD